MKQYAMFAVFLSVLCAGCGDTNSASSFAPISAAESAVVPEFLQEGKWYTVGTGISGFEIFVSAIDKQSGWIKGTLKDQTQIWLNTSQVLLFRVKEDKAAQ